MLQAIRNLTPTQWIILGISTAGFLNASTAQLTEWFGPHVSHGIISGLGFAQGLIGCWVMALNGQGGIVKQVLAMPGVQHIEVNANASATLAQIAVDKNVDKIAPDPTVQAKVEQIARVGALLVAFLLPLLLFSPSHAQGKLVPKPRPSAVASTTAVDPLQKLMDDIAAKKVEFVTGVVAALQEADSDAGALTNPNDPTSFRDPIAHACYPAQIKFLLSLPQVQAIQSPTPYNLIVLFQRKRDLIAEIRAGLPGYLKVGCSALLQDEATILLQTLGLIGVTIGAGTLTGIFPAAAPLTIPALTLPMLGGL